MKRSFEVMRLAALSMFAPALVGAQGAFVYTVGTDTIGIERFTLTPQIVMGELLMRGQFRLTYLATHESGRANSLNLVAYAADASPDAAPLQTADLRLVRDTVIAEIKAGGATQTQRLASKSDAILLVNSSIALVELALARLVGPRRDSATVPVFLAAGGQTLDATFRRVSADSIVAQLGGQQSHIVTRGTSILRLYMPAQRLVVTRVEGAATARLSLGKPDYSAPAGAPYRAEQVTIPTPAGHTLAGTLTIPQAATGRLPAVVTITGSGPQDRDESIPLVAGFRPFRQVADTLSRRGIIVLRYDDRGTGESTGNFATATSADFADDVRAAVAWLRKRPDVDPARIALVGHSEGGLIAPLVAASDAQLGGIVLMAGPSKRGNEILDFQVRYGVDHDSTIAPAKRDSVFAVRRRMVDTTAAPGPWMKFFLTYDPLPTIRKVKSPVLVLQGATDQQVTADQAEALGAALRQAGNRDVTVRVFPERNHLFLPDPVGNPAGYVRLSSGRVAPEVLGQLADWLASRLVR